MTVKNLVNEINAANLSIEDLRILNQLVVRKIKAQKTAAALSNAATLSVGMVVRVNHPKLEGLTGKITKIKRTKCDIKITSTGMSYVVPMNIVQAL
jgi:transcription antitermination factor NusG